MPQPETKIKRLAQHKRWLRRHFPSDYPVLVRLCSRSYMARYEKVAAAEANVPPATHLLLYGLTATHVSPRSSRITRFTILLAAELSTEMLLDTLREEWAHVLRAHVPPMPRDTDHDELYAVIRNRIEMEWRDEE